MSNPTTLPLAVNLIFYAFFAVGSRIVLETDGSGYLWIAFFIAKSILQFPGVMLLLWVHGLALTHYSKSIQAKLPGSEIVILNLAKMMLGIVFIGIEVFLLGQIHHPSYATWLPIIQGVALIWLLRHTLISEQAKLLRVAIVPWREIGRKEKIFFTAIVVLWSLKAIQLFDFQNHEDAYLYHTSLAETWQKIGQTGFTLDNVTSGYAWIAEHFYLLLKVALQGHAEQNALAQCVHFLLGFGIFLAAILNLLKPFGRSIQLVGLLIFLQTHFLAFLVVPKNDGFQLGALALAFWGLQKKVRLTFLVGCIAAPAMKICAAASLGVLSLFYLIKCVFFETRQELLRLVKLITLGAALSALALVPFLVHNFMQTGNPLFPIANNFFHSPYGPTTFASITGPTPFAVRFASLGTSILWLLKRYPFIAVGAFFVPIILTFGSVRLNVRYRESFKYYALGVIGLVVLSVVLGPIGSGVEDRYFLLFVGILMLASLLFVATAMRKLKEHQRTAILTIVSVLLVAQSGTDVAATRALRLLSKRQLTSTFLDSKPLMAINKELSHTFSGTEEPVVLVLSQSNTSYFLTKGRFIHSSISSPLIFDYPLITPKDWKKAIDQMKPDFIVVAEADYAECSKESDEIIPRTYASFLKKGSYLVFRKSREKL